MSSPPKNLPGAAGERGEPVPAVGEEAVHDDPVVPGGIEHVVDYPVTVAVDQDVPDDRVDVGRVGGGLVPGVVDARDLEDLVVGRTLVAAVPLLVEHVAGSSARSASPR